MSSTRWERTRTLTRGMWLAGIGVMLIRNRIVPDILFLIGAVRLVESCRHPERRRSFRAGVALIMLGLCITQGLAWLEILVLAVLFLAFTHWSDARPSDCKPKLDARLE